MRTMIARLALAASTLAIAATPLQAQSPAALEALKVTAEEAYLYGFPMIVGYDVMNKFFIDRDPVRGLRTHEPSSDFFYRMVRAAGGAAAFYGRIYVHAICPLGFVKDGPNGSAVNLNYYDDPALEPAVTPFVERWLRTLVACGMRTDTVLCIGTGKNASYFSRLNERLRLFDRIIALEHPRYVMQYKARSIEVYIDKYLRALEEVG